jgi:hypothetical protein
MFHMRRGSRRCVNFVLHGFYGVADGFKAGKYWKVLHRVRINSLLFLLVSS